MSLMDKKTKMLSIRVSRTDAERLKRKAHGMGVGCSHVVRLALLTYLNK